MVMHEDGPVDHQPGSLFRVDGSRPAWAVLTERQLTIMFLRASGMKLSSIAHHVGISLRTVKRDIRSVHDKLGATCDEDIYRDLGWLVVPNG